MRLSSTRTRLLHTLAALGYATQELLLTPLQFGVPNSRLRYYLLARWHAAWADAGTGAPIPPTTPTSGKFVDPLVARRQAKLEAQLSAGPPVPKALVGKKKVPVGELVAFFDQEKA